MAYKWKPSKSQRAAFAAKMADPEERAAYDARKEAREAKRRAGSRFNYTTAGGSYIPTDMQARSAARFLARPDLTPAERDACNRVVGAYTTQSRIHHDQIHIVNDLTRKHGA